jgi:hypothetical protein
MDVSIGTPNSFIVRPAGTSTSLPSVPQARVVPMVPGMRTRKRSSMMSGNSTAGSTNTTGDNDDMDSITDNDSMRPLADYTTRRSSRSHKRQRRTILDAFNSISLKGPAVSGTASSTPLKNVTSSSTINTRSSAKGLTQPSGIVTSDPGVLNSVERHNHHQLCPPHEQQQMLLSLHHCDGNQMNHLQYNDDADSARAVAEDNEHDEGGYTTNSSLEDEFYDDEDAVDEEEITYGDDDTTTMDEPMLSDKELMQKNVERKVYVLYGFNPFDFVFAFR